MKRKVIQIANSTQLVSLPRKWCLANGIKKGDELDVEEHGSKIIINVGPNEHRVEKRNLDGVNLRIFLLRAIVANYKTGVEEIEIRLDDPSLLHEISLLIQEDLPGFELLEQTNKSCLIKCVATEHETDFDPALRRIFLVTNSMGKQVAEYLRKPDPKLISGIKSMEKTCNRFCNFCERLLNKRGYKDSNKSLFVYCVVWGLEKISDEYKYLCQELAKAKGKPIQKEVVTMFSNAVEIVNMMQSLYYKFDNKIVADMAEKRKKIVKEGTKIIESSKGIDAHIAHYAINVTQEAFNILGLIFAIHS